MKKLIVVLGMSVAVVSCSAPAEEQKGMTENEAQAKIDSIVGERNNELLIQSMEDRDRRISIEVKPKADSIVAAWKAANPK